MKQSIAVKIWFLLCYFSWKNVFFRKWKLQKVWKRTSRRRKVKNHKWSKRCTNVEIKKTQSASRECFFHYFLTLLFVFVFNFGGSFSGQKLGKIFLKKSNWLREYLLCSPRYTLHHKCKTHRVWGRRHQHCISADSLHQSDILWGRSMSSCHTSALPRTLYM